MTKEALKLALEALEEIAFAGMSGTGQESDEAMTAWHARQAWRFIGIAARALDPIKEALAQRTWVDLTDEEFHDLQIENIDDPWANFKAIEAKLKEKNNGR